MLRRRWWNILDKALRSLWHHSHTSWPMLVPCCIRHNRVRRIWKNWEQNTMAQQRNTKRCRFGFAWANRNGCCVWKDAGSHRGQPIFLWMIFLEQVKTKWNNASWPDFEHIYFHVGSEDQSDGTSTRRIRWTQTRLNWIAHWEKSRKSHWRPGWDANGTK